MPVGVAKFCHGVNLGWWTELDMLGSVKGDAFRESKRVLDMNQRIIAGGSFALGDRKKRWPSGQRECSEGFYGCHSAVDL